jgi:hydroxymethylbilane synthase
VRTTRTRRRAWPSWTIRTPETRFAAERGFLAGLEGGCQVPISAWATIHGQTVTLTGMVSDTGGKRVVRETASGLRAEARAIGLALAGGSFPGAARR